MSLRVFVGAGGTWRLAARAYQSPARSDVSMLPPFTFACRKRTISRRPVEIEDLLKTNFPHNAAPSPRRQRVSFAGRAASVVVTAGPTGTLRPDCLEIDLDRFRRAAQRAVETQGFARRERLVEAAVRGELFADSLYEEWEAGDGASGNGPGRRGRGRAAPDRSRRGRLVSFVLGR